MFRPRVIAGRLRFREVRCLTNSESSWCPSPLAPKSMGDRTCDLTDGRGRPLYLAQWLGRLVYFPNNLAWGPFSLEVSLFEYTPISVRTCFMLTQRCAWQWEKRGQSLICFRWPQALRILHDPTLRCIVQSSEVASIRSLDLPYPISWATTCPGVGCGSHGPQQSQRSALPPWATRWKTRPSDLAAGPDAGARNHVLWTRGHWYSWWENKVLVWYLK